MTDTTRRRVCGVEAQLCGPVHQRSDGLWYFTAPHGDERGPFTMAAFANTVRDQMEVQCV